MNRGKRASFVVRIVENGPGQVSGVIERAATGTKEAFTGVEVIGPDHPAHVAARRPCAADTPGIEAGDQGHDAAGGGVELPRIWGPPIQLHKEKTV